MIVNNSYEAIKDELNFDVKKGIFGTYDAISSGEGEGLEITELDALNYINDNYDILDINDMISDIVDSKRELLEERLTELNFDNLDDIREYIEELETIEGELEEIEELEDVLSIEHLLEYEGDLINVSDLEESENSYNWSSQATLNWGKVTIEGEEYHIIRFHRYGDVRGNYTDYIMIPYEECLEFLYCSKSMTFEHEGKEINIYTNLFHEFRQVEVECDNDTTEVSLEAELSDIEEIKKEIIGLI